MDQARLGIAMFALGLTVGGGFGPPASAGAAADWTRQFGTRLTGGRRARRRSTNPRVVPLVHPSAVSGR